MVGSRSYSRHIGKRTTGFGTSRYGGSQTRRKIKIHLSDKKRLEYRKSISGKFKIKKQLKKKTISISKRKRIIGRSGGI